MEIRTADKHGRAMTEDEIRSYIEKPLIMRIGIIDRRDSFPMVHPVWYYYENGKFFVATDSSGIKARSLRQDGKLYFLIDSDPADQPPLGVRGKATARVIDDPEYATRVTVRNILRYLGSLESRTAQRIKAMGKDSSVLEITPLYMAAWKF